MAIMLNGWIISGAATEWEAVKGDVVKSFRSKAAAERFARKNNNVIRAKQAANPKQSPR